MNLKINVPSILLEISQQVCDLGGQLYLVGGSVRDALWGNNQPKDFDIEIHQLDGDQLFKILCQFGKVSMVGKSFGILLLKIKGVQYDFALPRKERKIGQGHKDFSIATDPWMGFKEAASRRDFSINAIGLKLPQFEIEDPWGGRQDLAHKLLKHIGPAFSEDPLRALRAVQFAARFDLSIAVETQRLCAEQDLTHLSVERFEEEFRKLLKSPKPSLGLEWIQQLQLVKFFPELDPRTWLLPKEKLYKAIDQMAFVFKDYPELERLIWMHSMLASAMPKENIDSWLSRFTQDRKLIEGVHLRYQCHEALVKAFELEIPFQGAVRRLALPFGIKERIYFTESWTGFSVFERVRFWAEKYGVWQNTPKSWVLGRDLIEIGYVPNPLFGEALKYCFDRQLDGEFNSKSEALAWIQEWMKERL